jgi:hypothetical protein
MVPMVGVGRENVLTMSQNVQVRDPTHCSIRGKASESGVGGVSGIPQEPLISYNDDVVLV